MHAGARDRAKTRFEADDAIERRRPDDGAERLRAQRQRDDTGRYCRRGARRRAARRMRRLPGIDRRSRMPPGEFRRDRLAENRGAETAQPLDHPGVGAGNMIAVDRRAIGGRHVRCRDDVLDRRRECPTTDPAGARVSRGRYSNALSSGSSGLRLLEASVGISIGSRRIVLELPQQFEDARAGRRCGARIRIGHAGKFPDKQARWQRLAWKASTCQRGRVRAYFIASAGSMNFLTTKVL